MRLHLLPLVGLTALSLSTFSVVASADEPACTTATLIASAPSAADNSGVPLDARIAFETSAGCRGPIHVEVRGPDGALVETKKVDWTGEGYFHSIKPSAPLAPNTTYRVSIAEESQRVGELQFTTGAAAYVPPASPRPLPTIGIKSGKIIGPTAADGNRMMEFTVIVHQNGAERLGVYHVDGLTRVTQLGADFLVSAHSELALGREEVLFTVNAWAKSGEQKCFTVTYENTLGVESAQSDKACVTVLAPTGAAPIGPTDPARPIGTTEPGPDPGFGDKDADASNGNGCACKTSGRTNGSAFAPLAAVLGLALVVVRRRRASRHG